MICHDCPCVSSVKLRMTEALVVGIKLVSSVDVIGGLLSMLVPSFPVHVAITVNVPTCVWLSWRVLLSIRIY